jgi:hypothetical protein
VRGSEMIDWVGLLISFAIGAFVGGLVNLYFDEKKDREW